jgi:hypothetical protein
MTMTPAQMAEGRTQAARKRLANKAARQATLEILEGGAKVYRDSPPGIGFVLEIPNGRKCYYMTSDQAKEMWVKRYKKDYSEGRFGKVVEGLKADESVQEVSGQIA